MCRVWGLGLRHSRTSFPFQFAVSVWYKEPRKAQVQGLSIGILLFAGTPCSNGRMGLSEFQCKAWRLCRNRLVPSETEDLGLGVFRFSHLGLQV